VKEQTDASARFQQWANAWGILIGRKLETASSIVGFGVRGQQAVVLKVAREQNDEWASGAVLRAFKGHGVARVIDDVPGAVLMEEVRPGLSLDGLPRAGRDPEAVKIIAEVIESMQTTPVLDGQFPTVEDWGKAFDRSYEAARKVIPGDMLDEARSRYQRLCETSTDRRLLRGDLQHYNILQDAKRGWVAIDPKGVTGELAFEMGAALRNPNEVSELLADPSPVERRVKQFSKLTACAEDRIAGWGFAQAVLSAVWTIEDDDELEHAHHVLGVARGIQPLLGKW
jgi:streptomycin 6-kinase